MNENEKKVLEIIRQNPFISQRDIGEELGLSRSTVATIISSLNNKNLILGRAYVLNEVDSPIFCFGGINVDRKYSLIENLQLGTSNPAHSQSFVGGVCRNVAENLGRLGHKPEMISVGGYDQDFEFIKKKSQDFVSFQYVKQIPGYSTGSYSAILNKDGEMQFALSVMEVLDEIDVNFISSFQVILAKAKLLVVDLNLPLDTVKYLVEFSKENSIDLIVIPVSSPKMKNLPKDLKGVKWLIVNQDESESFFGVKVKSDLDFDDLSKKWIESGVEQVIITRGNKYSIYRNSKGDVLKFLPPKVEKIVDVTGAGDSYSAGIIHGHLMNFPTEEIIEYALTNAYYTIQTSSTVREDLTRDKLKEQKDNLKNKGLIKWI